MANHDGLVKKTEKSAARVTRRAALGALVALPACLHQAHFSAGPVQGGRVAVPRAQLEALTGPSDVLYVRAEGAPGAIAVRRQGGGYTAVLALCTHRGCEVAA